MQTSKQADDKNGMTRRRFLKTVLPGLFAVGVVATAGTSQAPVVGAYGNGAYGGVPVDASPLKS